MYVRLRNSSITRLFRVNAITIYPFLGLACYVNAALEPTHVLSRVIAISIMWMKDELSACSFNSLMHARNAHNQERKPEQWNRLQKFHPVPIIQKDTSHGEAEFRKMKSPSFFTKISSRLNNRTELLLLRHHIECLQCW